MIVLEILLVFFFSANTGVSIACSALYMIGLWQLLKKSGIKGWWALVPFARDYQLSRGAGRENEGPVFSLTQFGLTCLDVLMLLNNRTPERASTIGTGDMILAILSLALTLVHFIYGIRVWAGMVNVYGLKKRWLFLCAFSISRFIPALVWGFGKKYQPGWKVEDINAELARLATQGSATVMDEGLTVNLTERTATEFFRRKVLLRDIHMAIPQGHMVLRRRPRSCSTAPTCTSITGKCSTMWASCPRAR